MLQWYPGHIAKWDRLLDDYLKQLDVVILVLDARAPIVTMGEHLLKRLTGKPILVLLNKAGLADVKITKAWMQVLTEQLTKDWQEHPLQIMPYDAHHSKPYQAKVISTLQQLGVKRIERLRARGIKREIIRAGAIGMPNVGKSSVMNSLVGQKKAHTGHRAGVTRDPQWIRIHPKLELLDTPGLTPPRFASDADSLCLAMLSGIGDNAFEDEAVALELVQRVEKLYPGHLTRVYQLSDPIEESLLPFSIRLGHIKAGDTWDSRRTAQILLKDFRNGKWEALSLEHPNT